jgi:hypothetical protein
MTTGGSPITALVRVARMVYFLVHHIAVSGYGAITRTTMRVELAAA